jgi:hypothetical protein
MTTWLNASSKAQFLVIDGLRSGSPRAIAASPRARRGQAAQWKCRRFGSA